MSVRHKNIRCGYSLESPRGGDSNEYPQHIFLCRNKQSYPVNIAKSLRICPTEIETVLLHLLVFLLLPEFYDSFDFNKPVVAHSTTVDLFVQKFSNHKDHRKHIFSIFHLSSLSYVLSFGRRLNMTEILWFRLLNPNGSCQLLPRASSLSTG